MAKKFVDLCHTTRSEFRMLEPGITMMNIDDQNYILTILGKVVMLDKPSN